MGKNNQIKYYPPEKDVSKNVKHIIIAFAILIGIVSIAFVVNFAPKLPRLIEKMRYSPLFSPELSVDEGLQEEKQGLVQLTAQEIEQIKIAKEISLRDVIQDFSAMYGLLETKKGQKERIFMICREFDPIFCLKKASEQNPEFRSEICQELEIRLREFYQNRVSQEKLNSFIDGHMLDCSLGIPQFMY